MMNGYDCGLVLLAHDYKPAHGGVDTKLINFTNLNAFLMTSLTKTCGLQTCGMTKISSRLLHVLPLISINFKYNFSHFKHVFEFALHWYTF